MARHSCRGAPMTATRLLAEHMALFIALVFVFSLLIGSFLNVVIHRLPIMMEREWRAQATELLNPDTPPQATGKYNLMMPPSACPQCRAPITPMQNIPIVSYLFLRGKCARCGAKISLRYPIVEFVTAILSAAIAAKYGVTWWAAAALVMTWSLIAVSASDLY